MKNDREALEKVYVVFCGAIESYFLCKELSNNLKEYRNKRVSHLFVYFQRSIEFYWMLSIAKLFDKKSKNGRWSYSLYYLKAKYPNKTKEIDKFIRDNEKEEIIKSIKKTRNRIIAHSDVATIKVVHKDLVNQVENFLNRLDKFFYKQFQYNSSIEITKESSKKLVKELLKNF